MFHFRNEVVSVSERFVATPYPKPFHIRHIRDRRRPGGRHIHNAGIRQ